MLQKLKEFFDEKGQGIVEYALILSFVAIIAIALFQTNGLQKSVTDSVKNTQDIVTKATEQGAQSKFGGT